MIKRTKDAYNSIKSLKDQYRALELQFFENHALDIKASEKFELLDKVGLKPKSEEMMRADQIAEVDAFRVEIMRRAYKEIVARILYDLDHPGEEPARTNLDDKIRSLLTLRFAFDVIESNIADEIYAISKNDPDRARKWGT